MVRLIIFFLLALFSTVQCQGNSVCAQWCAANFPNPGPDCTSLAADGTGPCYECGPLKTSPSQQLCGGACTDTDTDSTNCGSCDNVCSTSSTCQNGLCTPDTPPISSCPTPMNCGIFAGPEFCGGPGCLCRERANGAGNGCIQESAPTCSTQCAADTDCPSGEACVRTCCPPSLYSCMPYLSCVSEISPPRLFRRIAGPGIAA